MNMILSLISGISAVTLGRYKFRGGQVEFESGQIDVAPSLSGIRSPGVLLPWFNLVQPGSAKKGGKLMGGLDFFFMFVSTSCQ